MYTKNTEIAAETRDMQHEQNVNVNFIENLKHNF
jgi:hypothetical protein